MTATVTIYHNETPRHRDHKNPKTGRPCGMFWGFCGSCSLKEVYSYEAGDRVGLEEIFEDNQNGIGGAERTQGRYRSLSVGDVVVIGDEAFSVESLGFAEADPNDVQRARKNGEAA